MADEEQVEVRLGEEAGAGKVKRKSIKKAARRMEFFLSGGCGKYLF